MQNIITIQSTPGGIVEKLKILSAIFPKGVTLYEIKKAINFIDLQNTTKKQINEIIKRL